MAEPPPADEFVIGRRNEYDRVPPEEHRLIGPTTAVGDAWTAMDEKKSKAFVRFLIDTLQIDTSHEPPILDSEMTPEHVEAIARQARDCGSQGSGLTGIVSTCSHDREHLGPMLTLRQQGARRPAWCSAGP